MAPPARLYRPAGPAYITGARVVGPVRYVIAPKGKHII